MATTKLQLGTVYTFNVSPDNDRQYECRPKGSLADRDRLESFVKYWTRFFQEFTISEVEFYLQIELSEPVLESHTTQRSRLHFHGYISFPNASSLKWFLLYGTILLSEVSRYTIGTIGDPDTWYQYVTKQSFLGLPVIEQFNGLDRFYKKGDPKTCMNPPKDCSLNEVTSPSQDEECLEPKRRKKPKK